MTLVDTSSWIQYLRRDGEAEMKEKVRSLLLDGAAVLCPVVIANWGSGNIFFHFAKNY
jgi:predicted nucleic acid-binding protein